jgi:hypothetical protein
MRAMTPASAVATPYGMSGPTTMTASESTTAPVPQSPARDTQRGTRLSRPTWLADRTRAALVLVCALHALSPLVFLGVHFWFGWDESVYVSQLSSHAPPGLFSAPRARGMPLIVAPVSSWTGSIVAMRLYLAMLSGVALYVGFRPWQRLRPGYSVPLAALLFSSLWVSAAYGFQAMPNEYVAYGALAATGCLLLTQRPAESRWRRYAGYVALAMTATALVRPTDSIFIAAPLAIAALRSAHRLSLLAAVWMGVAIGWGEWFIEALINFGGPAARLHSASAENATGLHFALPAELSTLGGPGLCRGACRGTSPQLDRLWFYALVVLAIVGLAAARRRGGTWLQLVATAVAICAGAQYIFFIPYAAPRFLLPTYALLAIPAAEGVVWLATRSSGFPRSSIVASLVVLLGGHLAVQYDVLHNTIAIPGTAERIRNVEIAPRVRPRETNAPVAAVFLGRPTRVLRPGGQLRRIKLPGVNGRWYAYIRLPPGE